MAETQCRVAICPVIPVTDGAVEHCVVLFLCAVKLIEFDAKHCGLKPTQAAPEATEATAAAVTVTVAMLCAATGALHWPHSHMCNVMAGPSVGGD